MDQVQAAGCVQLAKESGQSIGQADHAVGAPFLAIMSEISCHDILVDFWLQGYRENCGAQFIRLAAPLLLVHFFCYFLRYLRADFLGVASFEDARENAVSESFVRLESTDDSDVFLFIPIFEKGNEMIRSAFKFD